ncbi:MAG: ABC transporter permease [Gemmatimonadales bacterium]
MLKTAAFLRMDILTAASYRLQMLLSLAGLLATAVPLYFIARALQPMMAGPIRGEGDDFFAFVLVGMVAFQFMMAAIFALPTTLANGIRTGTLEALFVTPVRMTTLLQGMMAYNVLWAGAKSVVLLAVGWALGVRFAGGQLLPTALIISLIVLAYAPFGILGGALIVVYRTTGPVLRGVLAVSTLLGGVYFPTKVVPSWLSAVSTVTPLTYGLRALRRTLLEGVPLSAVADDLAILAAFILVLWVTAVAVWQVALRHARMAGTLAQY